jgi:hypothetical protein
MGNYRTIWTRSVLVDILCIHLCNIVKS